MRIEISNKTRSITYIDSIYSFERSLLNFHFLRTTIKWRNQVSQTFMSVQRYKVMLKKKKKVKVKVKHWNLPSISCLLSFERERDNGGGLNCKFGSDFIEVERSNCKIYIIGGNILYSWRWGLAVGSKGLFSKLKKGNLIGHITSIPPYTPTL